MATEIVDVHIRFSIRCWAAISLLPAGYGRASRKQENPGEF
jgi:hypothetical protein